MKKLVTPIIVGLGTIMVVTVFCAPTTTTPMPAATATPQPYGTWTNEEVATLRAEIDATETAEAPTREAYITQLPTIVAANKTAEPIRLTQLAPMPNCSPDKTMPSLNIASGYAQSFNGQLWGVGDDHRVSNITVLHTWPALELGKTVEPGNLGVCTTLNGDGSVLFETKSP